MQKSPKSRWCQRISVQRGPDSLLASSWTLIHQYPNRKWIRSISLLTMRVCLLNRKASQVVGIFILKTKAQRQKRPFPECWIYPTILPGGYGAFVLAHSSPVNNHGDCVASIKGNRWPLASSEYYNHLSLQSYLTNHPLMIKSWFSSHEWRPIFYQMLRLFNPFRYEQRPSPYRLILTLRDKAKWSRQLLYYR